MRRLLGLSLLTTLGCDGATVAIDALEPLDALTTDAGRDAGASLDAPGGDAPEAPDALALDAPRDDAGSDAGCGPRAILRDGLCVPRPGLPHGDLDGDGLSDVAVGSYGSVSIFSGRDRGDPWMPSQVLSPPRAGDPNFGAELALLGDTDGDGFGELAVMERGRGYAWVFRGGAGGLDTTTPIELVGCTTPSDTCDGESIAAAGDVDGDGMRDLLVVRSTVRDFRVYETAYLFPGARAGLATTPSWSAPDESARGAGDVDGDGFDDLLVTPDYGRVRIVYGSAAGPSTRETPLLGTYEIRAVRGVGDLNADGCDDVVLLDATGAASPRLLVYMGGETGLGGSAVQSIDVPESYPADFETDGLTRIGDFDGDSYEDVAVAAAAATGGAPRPSRVLIWWGGPDGITTEAPVTFERDGIYGAPISGAGDVDGDGLADVVLAAAGLGTVQVLGDAPRGTTVTSARVLSGGGSRFGIALGEPL